MSQSSVMTVDEMSGENGAGYAVVGRDVMLPSVCSLS